MLQFHTYFILCQEKMAAKYFDAFTKQEINIPYP